MEMINDIGREMRELAKEVQGNSISNAYELLMGLADRIEKAHEFELAVEKAKAAGEGYAAGKQSVTDCNQPVTDCHGLNMAKAREALNRARRTLSKWKIDTPVSAWNEFDLAMDGIDAALSAPPRNCDKYATLDDARNAFFADYVPDETCSSATAFAIWLFDEAKGE